MDKSTRRLAAAITVLILLAATVSVANAEPECSPFGLILFKQQDMVKAFDIVTGKGYQIGTATGIISGTTFVEFQFAPTAPPVGDEIPITFQNKVIITDIDGDQIFFDNNGTGSYHIGAPGFGFQGTGGPLTGTYVVTGATGKYQSDHSWHHRWAVGSTFRYRAITTNPPTPGALGTVYVEISCEHKHR